ncbi:Antitoxin CptB [Thiorhodovibrio winogradskyi]|uniref:FAD assembly factor SdhE n=1 Tax=Thiorhodovibrio winogradskyi TaxID=77007 RepID=A0ABZ0S544_9GAMM|nr:succinate dehydrogenase assembly factor 2 [Thiorhodovibrio winogradskyi]
MDDTEPLSADADLRRLRWQCRRGMLELDLLLSDFIDQGYAQLSSTERADFARLLGCQDQRLHDWLIGHSEPSDAALRALVERIRSVQLEPGQEVRP